MAAYYTPGTPATANTLARAESMATEFITIQSAFNKIPEQVSLEQDRAAYALDTGAADAYVVTMPSTWTAYTTGAKLQMKAVNVNTGASTINVDGLGVKTITRFNGDALAAGDIPAGSIMEYLYDGTNFQTVGISITGHVIGTDVQAWDAQLDDIAALDLTDGNFIVANGSNWIIEGGAVARSSLGLGGQLFAIPGLSLTDGNFIVANGSTWVAESGATARTSLGLTIGTDVQADLDVPSQAEAEAGTATTERAFTAQRVKQAIVALATVGKHTIWAPAPSIIPTASNGCAALATVETTAGRPDLNVLDFDASADEHGQFTITFPKSWNNGTITFQIFWTSTATDTDGVAWGLQGVATADDDTIDVAYGTAVVVTDDNISAAEDCLVTAESGAVTIAGSPAAGELCHFRVFRDVSDGNDDMTEDARLIGVKLFFTTDAASDD
jgi:hypothetical protein